MDSTVISNCSILCRSPTDHINQLSIDQDLRGLGHRSISFLVLMNTTPWCFHSVRSTISNTVISDYSILFRSRTDYIDQLSIDSTVSRIPYIRREYEHGRHEGSGRGAAESTQSTHQSLQLSIDYYGVFSVERLMMCCLHETSHRWLIYRYQPVPSFSCSHY